MTTPAFTTPHTFTATEVMTATTLNTHLRDNTNALFGNRSCQLALTTNQSIPNNAWTAVNWTPASTAASPEQWDVFPGAGFYDQTASLSRLTIPNVANAAGIYRVEANIKFAYASGNKRAFGFRKNGAGGERYMLDILAPISGTTPPAYLTGSTTFNLAATDYVEVIVFQDSGGAVNLQLSYFTINYLGQST